MFLLAAILCKRSMNDMYQRERLIAFLKKLLNLLNIIKQGKEGFVLFLNTFFAKSRKQKRNKQSLLFHILVWGKERRSLEGEVGEVHCL